MKTKTRNVTIDNAPKFHRDRAIERLEEVGRNPRHLHKLSNDELRDALEIERPKLEAIAAQKAEHARQIELARQARERKQREEQQRPLREAAYRRKAARWMAPIVAHRNGSLDALSAGRRASEAQRRYNYHSHLYRQTGIKEHARQAAQALLEKNAMERFIRSMGVMGEVGQERTTMQDLEGGLRVKA